MGLMLCCLRVLGGGKGATGVAGPPGLEQAGGPAARGGGIGVTG